MSHEQTTTSEACPDCGKPLDVMRACGATQYFCPHCNELKSSRRVQEAQAAKTASDPARKE